MGNLIDIGTPKNEVLERRLSSEYDETIETAFRKVNKLFASQAGVTLIAAPNSPRSSREAAGIICGGTDAQVQINAALALGTPVRLAPGSYSVSDSIEMPDNSTLFVDGATVTLVAGADVSVLTNSDTSGGNSNIVVVGNGTFDHNGANQTSSTNGVHFNNVDGLYIEGFKATGGRGWDVRFTSVTNAGASRIETYGPGGGANAGGFNLTNTCEAVSLYRVYCHSHTDGSGYGLWITGTDITATDCIAKGNDDDNLVVGNAAANEAVRVTINGGLFVDSVSDGGAHFTSGCVDVTVNGAVFSNNDGMGYKVSGNNIEGVTLSGCTASDNGESGAFLGSDGAIVVGNIIQNNSHRGVFFSGNSDQVQVTNSQISGNTLANVEFHSSATVTNALVAFNMIHSGSNWGIDINGTVTDVMLIGNYIEGNTSGGVDGAGAASGVTTQLNWGAQKPADVDERS